MKADALSLRQITVLTVAGLLAPGADILPKLLAETSGRAGWIAPLLCLPVLLIWTALLRSLLKGEGQDLTGALRAGFGPFLGGVFRIIYIMWGILLLTDQTYRSASRLGAVYGMGVGRTFSALMLVLVLWMTWGKLGAVCRAAELFWLALAAAAAGILLLSVPQVELKRLAPSWRELGGLSKAWRDCLGLLGTGIFAAVLTGKAPRTKKGGRLLAWAAGVCLLLAALTAAVLGQVGAELTAKLPHPFSIMVQGLSLGGGFARLEAPMAALWLMADFARAALLLSAIRTLTGERAGRWVSLLSAVAAAVGQIFFSGTGALVFGGLFLGIGVPAALFLLCRAWKQ